MTRAQQRRAGKQRKSIAENMKEHGCGKTEPRQYRAGKPGEDLMFANANGERGKAHVARFTDLQ